MTFLTVYRQPEPTERDHSSTNSYIVKVDQLGMLIMGQVDEYLHLPVEIVASLQCLNRSSCSQSRMIRYQPQPEEID